MNDDVKPVEGDLNAQELTTYVSEVLGSQVKSLSIEVSQQGITVHGSCGSFYVKQLAQEIVKRKSPGRQIVANNIVVRYAPK